MGAVESAFSDPGGGALAVAGSVEVAGALLTRCLFSPHAAISALSAAVPTPSSASRRSASRLDISPSTWSVAISSAKYRCRGVTFASMRQDAERG